jgi:hypothetical protein
MQRFGLQEPSPRTLSFLLAPAGNFVVEDVDLGL